MKSKYVISLILGIIITVIWLYVRGDLPPRITFRDEILSNSFLGITAKIPKGWWVYEVYSENFNSSPRTTLREDSLKVYKSLFIELIDVGNTKKWKPEESVAVLFYAAKLDDTTIDQYINFIIEDDKSLLEKELAKGDYTEKSLVVIELKDILINNVECKKMLYGIIKNDDGAYENDNDYKVFNDHYIYKNGDYFITILFSYDEKNAKAKDIVVDFLSGVTFE